MKKKRSRIAWLGRPLVAGAAAAPFAGCAGSTQGDGTGTDSGGGAPDPRGPNGPTGQVMAGCPGDPPVDGAACGEPQACHYPGRACSGVPETDATCVGQRWQVTTIQWSCNPPPVGPPPSTTCPEMPPRSGDPCNIGFPCEYGSIGGCTMYLAAHCEGGRWQLYDETPSCNPPPVELPCPNAPPVHGDPCQTVDDCAYPGDPCVGEPEINASCQQGRWSVLVEESSCNPPVPDPDEDAGI